MNEQKQKFSHFLTLCDDYATAQLAFLTAERAAFGGELSAAQEAIGDMNRLQGEIREAISAVNAAITELRAKTLGDPLTGLWENRLDGARKGFAPLCQEVGA